MNLVVYFVDRQLPEVLLLEFLVIRFLLSAYVWCLFLVSIA